ncbi:uncharacterized protein VTP21DRAFT_3938 [Calcarisporiella thermophila]|uniref:uncharacterized protein n=1 Tax=Calcarisporiella thermophila TaxID=911321 RepID=UPI003743D9A5
MWGKNEPSLPMHRSTFAGISSRIKSTLISDRRSTFLYRILALLASCALLWMIFARPTTTVIELSPTAHTKLNQQKPLAPPLAGGNRSKNPDVPTWKKEVLAKVNDRYSIFTREQFTPQALENNGLIPVTAVLLGWKRIESLQFVIKYLTKYPYIKEILIWNNNKEIRLNAKDFELEPSAIGHVELQVFNSDENLHDLSKYTTCALSKYDYCYFQDDDWLNLYMDSLYSNFLKHPTLIHSNTMPIIHLEHRRWMFTDTDINLHTGFTWLGCGSFLQRDKVHRFLAQLGQENLPRERLRLADMYFSIWTNQYPYQLSNPLTPLDQDKGWSTSVDQWAIVYGNIYDAASKLHKALSVNVGENPEDYFVREEQPPLHKDRDVRAPCLNDKCLFTTNIDAFPHPSQVRFSPNKYRSVKHQEEAFNSLDFPSNTFWDQHAYHNAVDLDPKTCWNSHKAPKVGDYFGLTLLKAIPSTSAQVEITFGKVVGNAKFELQVHEGGDSNWTRCSARMLTSSTPEKLRMSLASCPVAKVAGLRFIATQVMDPFEVCGIQVGDIKV